MQKDLPHSYNVVELTNTKNVKAKTYTFFFEGVPEGDEFFRKMFDIHPKLVGIRPAQLDEVWIDNIDPSVKVITRGPPIILPSNVIVFPKGRSKWQKTD
jgi:hypothetical protein